MSDSGCLCGVLCNKYVLGTVAVFTIIKLYVKLTTGVCKSKKRLDGKTVIVTGANTGIGKVTAQDLARRGARVILACRNIEKANEAKDEIITSTGNNNVVVKHLDLASLSSVREFAKDILSSENRLDILVNNAGLAGVGKKITKDNLLLGMQANHFGPFLLTNLLIGLLKKSAPSRIVMVSSLAHRNAVLDMNNLNAEKSFSDMTVYANSKLANILMATELAQRLQGTGVTANSLHPGVVVTDIWRRIPEPAKTLVLLILKMFFKSTEEGAQTTIHVAVSEEVEGVTGKYFSDCKETKPYKNAQDEGLAKKLWEKSEELVKLTREEKFI